MADPASDPTYELTYRLTPLDILRLPLFVGLILFGGRLMVEIILDPAISNWQVLFPFEPQVMALAGVFGLLIRLSWIVQDRAALRIDPYGILLEAPWPLPRIRDRAAWSDLATVELLRLKPQGVGPIPVRNRYLRLWRFDDPDTLPQKHAVAGLPVDRKRLTAAIQHYAPHVRIVDRW